jgi:hypothetical protein
MHAVWERQTFTTSPAISKSLDAALQVSGLRKEDIDLFDFYSFVPPIPLVGLIPDIRSKG